MSSAAGPDGPRDPLILFAGSIFNRRRLPDLIEAFKSCGWNTRMRGWRSSATIGRIHTSSWHRWRRPEGAGRRPAALIPARRRRVGPLPAGERVCVPLGVRRVRPSSARSVGRRRAWGAARYASGARDVPRRCALREVPREEHRRRAHEPSRRPRRTRAHSRSGAGRARPLLVGERGAADAGSARRTARQGGRVSKNSRRARCLAILIVSYNAAADLERCLQSLRQAPPHTSHDVVVIDNASRPTGA